MWLLRRYIFVQKTFEKLDENGGVPCSSGILAGDQIMLN